MTFDKILIANRGEIACRVIKTAQRLGISCVAVYSTADQHALHVKMADEAYHIGEAPSAESYLKIDKILQVAQQARVQAIHPGYGFLSENPGFATACHKAGIIFIGPDADAISTMGDKSQAKSLLEKKAVPLVPGYHGSKQDLAFLKQQAEIIGYPILLKAASGGGGKGMRVVNKAEEFDSAYTSAKREALKSFADDTLLIEKFIQQPRHIEIQLFADTRGNYVYLFERDCSIQRRHQKIIEEAPAPGVSQALRDKMGQAAIEVAKAINYSGAGTIEFLLDADNNFYFMEMNTRLQVEHPVTEMISGIDLVEWQLLVAAGDPLPLQQSDLTIHGHAIEARLYAEDPENDFLPSCGEIYHLRFPFPSEHIRVDHGLQPQDEISTYYDPMIAKVIAWDIDRDSAIRRLRSALWETQIVGLKTNTQFLRRILVADDYQQAHVTTHFIDDHLDALFSAREDNLTDSLALTTLYLLLKQPEENKAYFSYGNDVNSPWSHSECWRLNSKHQQTFEFIQGNELVRVLVEHEANRYHLNIAGEKLLISGVLINGHDLTATINDRQLNTTIIQHGNEFTLFGHQLHACISIQTLETIVSDVSTEGNLTSPMPGMVVSILVTPNEQVSKGTPLLIIEAMKMEHTIHAPHDGVVKQMFFQQGDLVDEGVELLEFETE